MKRFVCVLALCLLSTSVFAQEKTSDDQSKAVAQLQDQVKTLSTQVSALTQQLQANAKPAESKQDQVKKALLATKENGPAVCALGGMKLAAVIYDGEKVSISCATK
jgi:DNA-binding ferritin-like protein